MNIVLAIGMTSFVLCMILTPLCRGLARRYGLVDQPDTERKLHKTAVPRIGGVPIVLAYVGALGLVLLLTPASDKLHIQHQRLLWSLLPAAGLVFLTGLADDLFTLKPWQKLAGQLIAAGLTVSSGTHLTLSGPAFFPNHPFLATPWISAPLSIIWLVGCTNALNLIDGMDGLASGVGLFAAITTLLAGIFTGNTGLILATMPLVGCLLAFLYFNFSPASIFLGDSGSLTIGFLLGSFSLVWGQQRGSLLGMAAPLMALVLPLLDVGLAIARRSLRRAPIFKADRGHIHHMMLDRGFKPRQAALILYGVCSVAASLALLETFSPSYIHVAVIVVFLILVWAGINYLDYIEIGAARRVVSRTGLLRHVRENIYLEELDRALDEAEGARECWDIVRQVSDDMHFDVVDLILGDQHFRQGGDFVNLSLSWHITLPIGEQGSLSLGRTSADRSPKLMLAALERLQQNLVKRSTPAPLPVLLTVSGRKHAEKMLNQEKNVA